MNHQDKVLSSIGTIAGTNPRLLQAPQIDTSERQDRLATLKDAANEFEAYFISNLLKVMRETVPQGALENRAGSYFYSFYDEEIGRLASQAGGLGLSKIIQEYTEKSCLPQVFIADSRYCNRQGLSPNPQGDVGPIR